MTNQTEGAERLRDMIMMVLLMTCTLQELFVFDILQLEKSIKPTEITTKRNIRSGFIPTHLVTPQDFEEVPLADLEKYYQRLVEYMNLDVPEYKLVDFMLRYNMHRDVLKEDGII